MINLNLNQICQTKLNQNQLNYGRQSPLRMTEKTIKFDIERRIQKQMRLILNRCVPCKAAN